MIRQLAGIVIFAIGAFLLYRVFAASSAFVERGGTYVSYLMEPPTGLLQLAGAGLMAIGGLLTALKVWGGGTIGLLGSLIIALLGGLLLASTSQITDGLDEALYAAAGVLLSILILTFKRN